MVNMRNERGMIALAVILSILLMVAAMAVFSLVTGRFSPTMHINNRILAIRDAEAASYATYQMIRQNTWSVPGPGDDPNDYEVELTRPNIYGTDETVIVDIEVYDDGKVVSKVQY